MCLRDETVNGQPVTDDLIQAWADEAERDYDVETLRKCGRPTLGNGPAPWCRSAWMTRC
jgi:hypothetical protein